MKKGEKLIELINNPQTISSSETTFLENILVKYPFFQSGQLLLAKALLNNNSILYKKHLKKAAAHSLDRKKLFKLINFKKNSRKIKHKGDNIYKQTFKEKELKIEEKFNLDKIEKYSFSEWLTVINAKKIERKEDSKEKSLERLLEKEIKISKPKKEIFFKATDAAKESVIENYELVTPTLAKVYLEQQHYDKAIKAYEKLILRNPKKSSFFAAQIKLIKKINK